MKRAFESVAIADRTALPPARPNVLEQEQFALL